MNNDNARRFAATMIATWPNGPRRHIWHDIALELETAPARTALKELQRTIRTHPNPAHLYDAYNAALRAQQRRHQQNATIDVCEQCAGTGWIDAQSQARPNSTAVKPCHCTTGQHMKQTQQRILDHNGTHTNPEHQQLDYGT